MSQHQRIRELMSDGQWRTIDQIAALTGIPPTSVSARLRQLRQMGWVVLMREETAGAGFRVNAYQLLQQGSQPA